MPFKNLLFLLLVVIYRHAAQKIKCSCATVTSGIGSGTWEAHRSTWDLPVLFWKHLLKKEKTAGYTLIQVQKFQKDTAAQSRALLCVTQRKLSASLAAIWAPAHNRLQAQQDWHSSPKGHSTSQAQMQTLVWNTCVSMMEQEKALKTLRIQHSKTADKGQQSRSCPDSWLPYRRYLPKHSPGHS